MAVTKEVEKTSDEMVELFLFKDDDKYKHDLWVCVNGERLLIPRGVKVNVPIRFARVFKSSQKQEQLLIQKMKQLMNEA